MLTDVWVLGCCYGFEILILLLKDKIILNTCTYSVWDNALVWYPNDDLIDMSPISDCLEIHDNSRAAIPCLACVV